VTTYRVSELAEQAGLPPSTVRFYERAGLLPARRAESGYRLFDEKAVERIELITTGKRLGLQLEDIRHLLQVWQDGLCRDVRAWLKPVVLSQIAGAQRQAAEIDAFIERLQKASLAIESPVPPGRCDSGCCAVPGPEPVPAAAGPSTAGPSAAGPSTAGLSARRRDANPEPQIACTLAPAERPGRLEDWRRLLGQARAGSPVEGGLAFLLPARLAGRAAELAAAEQQCCPFFEFTLHLAAGELRLEMRAPEGALPMLAQAFGAGVAG
jgi:MerR family transcriptional regulator, copper efflux regulator